MVEIMARFYLFPHFQPPRSSITLKKFFASEVSFAYSLCFFFSYCVG